MEDLSNFHFLRPLLLFMFIPAGLFVWALLKNKIGQSSWEKICDSELIPHILIRNGAYKNLWPVYLLGIASSLTILALAGPSWEKISQPVFRSQSSLVILLDLSQSMNATDLKPSRLERAKYKLIDILNDRKEGETALIVYAGDAFTVTPLTRDHETIISQLPALNPELMPVQGAHADIAIKLADNLMKQSGRTRGDILLITDDADLTGDLEVAEESLQQGYRVSVMAVGTIEGSPIPSKQGGFLKDKTGNIVIPAMDSEKLKLIASAGGGRYVNLSLDDSDVKTLAGFFDVAIGKNDEQQTQFKTDRWKEQGPWLLLLLLPVVSLVFRRGYILSFSLLILPVPEPVQAFSWDQLWLNENQQAQRLLDQGEERQAIEKFTDPKWKAAAQYKAGEYEQSLATIKDHNGTESLYNKGNMKAKLGQYEQAIQYYDDVLKTEPDHEDALYNRKIVEQALKKQQQEKQSKTNDKQNSGSENQQPQQEQGNRDNPDDKNENPSQQQSSESGQNPNQTEQSHSQKENDGQNDSYDSNEEQQAGLDHDIEKNKDSRNNESQHSESDRQNSNRVNQAKEEKNSDMDKEKTLPSQSIDQQSAKNDEHDQADEQWLRRIPDDPGGLLRRKFLYQYKQRARAQSNHEKNW